MLHPASSSIRACTQIYAMYIPSPHTLHLRVVSVCRICTASTASWATHSHGVPSPMPQIVQQLSARQGPLHALTGFLRSPFHRLHSLHITVLLAIFASQAAHPLTTPPVPVLTSIAYASPHQLAPLPLPSPTSSHPLYSLLMITTSILSIPHTEFSSLPCISISPISYTNHMHII